jgi:DNA replication protein DnaC
MLYWLGRVDLLIVDDWAMAPLTEDVRRDFLEICAQRYQARSTLLTNQLPVASWHA